MTGGRLYVCATPIGNLEDVTHRLLRVLQEVNLIAAEDTRHTRRLCSRFGITTPLVSCHQGNEAQRTVEIVERLRRGHSVAYVSDAGTPAISDPGARLVAAIYDAGLQVVPIPGPSAVTTALSVAGFVADSFVSLGFLPLRSRERQAVIDRIVAEPLPVVIFESPHRIEKTLADLLSAVGPERPAWAGRELTKSYESLYRGSLGTVCDSLLADPLRGEYTLILGPWPEAAKRDGGQQRDDVPLAEQVEKLISTGLSPSEAIRQVARSSGLARREVYRRVKIDKKNL